MKKIYLFLISLVFATNFSGKAQSYLNVSSNTLSVGYAANSSGTITVSSNLASWTAAHDFTMYPWISVSPTMGAGNQNITITATSQNPTATPRVAQVVVSGTGVSVQTITITQQGIPPTLSLSASTLSLAWSISSSGTIDITSNTTWTASVDQSWLSVLPLTGYGNTTITMKALTENISSAPRTATVTITVAGLPTQTITVTQQNTLPTLSIVNAPYLAYSSGSIGYFAISTNTSWTASCDQSWGTLSATSGKGYTSVTLTASSANTSFSARTANITVTVDGLSAIIVVATQYGTPSISLSANTLALDSTSNSSGTITVTSNVNWTVSTVDTWLTLSPASGTTSGTLTITAIGKYVNATPRTATVTITGTGAGSKTITVTQRNETPKLDVSSNSLTLNTSINSSGTASVTSNLPYWSASTYDTWISVSPSSSSLNGTVTITALSANPYSTARTATVTISASMMPQHSITVTQLPNLLAQTITFSALPAKSTTDVDFSPGATASSGLVVSYASSNASVATIVNGKIHMTGAGVANITASQAGNSSYNPAPDVIQALTVNKSTQTITFNALPAKTISDADFDPGATASSVLTLTYASSNQAVATIVNGKIHMIGAGTSIITASQSGNGLYLPATDVTQTLTVNNLLSQTITFNALPAKSAVDVDFDPGATASSALPIVYTSSNNLVATIVNGKICILGVGATSITASQAGNSIYNAAANVIQPLTVNAANQTITFNALPTKSTADVDFDPGAMASSGLTVSYTSSNASVATIVNGKVHIVGVGITSITASQTGNNSYNGAANVIQTLTVNLATGITKDEGNTTEFYPNPAHATLFLKRNNALHSTISLSDLSGHIILTKLLNNEFETFDVSSLQPGIYVIKITNDSKTQIKKVVIE